MLRHYGCAASLTISRIVLLINSLCRACACSWQEEKLKKEWFNDQNKVRNDVGLIGPGALDSKMPTEVECSTAFCDTVPVSEVRCLHHARVIFAILWSDGAMLLRLRRRRG